MVTGSLGEGSVIIGVSSADADADGSGVIGGGAAGSGAAGSGAAGSGAAAVVVVAVVVTISAGGCSASGSFMLPSEEEDSEVSALSLLSPESLSMSPKGGVVDCSEELLPDDSLLLSDSSGSLGTASVSSGLSVGLL